MNAGSLEIAVGLVAVLCVCFYAAGYTRGHDDGRTARRIKPREERRHGSQAGH